MSAELTEAYDRLAVPEFIRGALTEALDQQVAARIQRARDEGWRAGFDEAAHDWDALGASADLFKSLASKAEARYASLVLALERQIEDWERPGADFFSPSLAAKLRALLESHSKERVESVVSETRTGVMRLGSCCYSVGTDACACENPTNWAAPHIDFNEEPLRPVRGRRVTEEDVDW